MWEEICRYYDIRPTEDMLANKELIVNNIIKLFDELNLQNVHKMFYVFCYLLWSGYFSDNKLYVYDTSDIIDDETTIFTGRGCCRHKSDLFHHVIKKYYFSQELAICSHSSKSIGLEDIKRIQKYYPRTPSPSPRVLMALSGISNFKKTLNHSVNLVKADGWILLDATNLMECEILKNYKVVPLVGEYDIHIGLLREKLKKHYIKPTAKTVSISSEALLELYKEAKEICIKNIPLFDDFFEENKENYARATRLVIKQTTNW